MILIIKELNFLFQKKITAELKHKTIFTFCYKNGLTYRVYVSDQKFHNSMDFLLISNGNKSHYVYIKILTDLCVMKQKIKTKNIFSNVVYSVLVVKKF